MKFPLWSFWGQLLMYCIASAVVFVLTTAGWTGLVIVPGAGIFYGSILLLALIISTILYAQGTREIELPLRGFWFVIVLQALAALSNPGDCGDAPGGSAFIFRLLLPNDVICQSNTFYSSGLFSSIGLGLMVILIASTLSVLGWIYWKARPRKILSTAFLVVLYVVISLTLVSAGLWYTWISVGADYRREFSYLQVNESGTYSDCHVSITYNDPSRNPVNYCESLLKKYGYSYERDFDPQDHHLLGYVLTGRHHSFLDALSLIFRGSDQ